MVRATLSRNGKEHYFIGFPNKSIASLARLDFHSSIIFSSVLFEGVKILVPVVVENEESVT